MSKQQHLGVTTRFIPKRYNLNFTYAWKSAKREKLLAELKIILLIIILSFNIKQHEGSINAPENKQKNNLSFSISIHLM